MEAPVIEPPAQLPCPGRCLVHLHSEAGRAWFLRRYNPYPRRLGPDGISYFLVKLGNNAPAFVSAHGIHTFHLRRTIANFERSTGRQVQNIIAFIPATINPDQYQSELTAIATSAGVRLVEFMERSELAVLSCKYLHSPGLRTVLVFELGGQFLEISLFTDDADLGLNKMASVFDLGCPLFNHVISSLPNSVSSPNFTHDAIVLRGIRTKCERAKNALCSGALSALITVDHHGFEATLCVDRVSLVQMNLNHLRRGIQRCLSQARVRQEAVDKVVLVGASATMPEVLNVLREFFQSQLIISDFDTANLIRSAITEYQNFFSATTNTPVTGFQTSNLGLCAL